MDFLLGREIYCETAHIKFIKRGASFSLGISINKINLKSSAEHIKNDLNVKIKRLLLVTSDFSLLAKEKSDLKSPISGAPLTQPKHTASCRAEQVEGRRRSFQ